MFRFKPVDQEILDKGYGDCLRACYASLLRLPIDAVPNFIRHKHRWFLVLQQFLYSCGWEFCGSGHQHKGTLNMPVYEDSVNGLLRASVHSRVFEGGTHAVVINCDGLVIHDPSPYKRHQGVNVVNSEELILFDILRRRTDVGWRGWSERKGVTK